MIELENTYLAKRLPNDLHNYPSKEIIDVYIPAAAFHPVLRFRKNGDRYEMTKKEPVTAGDASRQEEQTINLSEEEFNALSTLEGKRVEKRRYLVPIDGRQAEVDVFMGKLAGLVLIDFEFETVEDKDEFAMPDICLADVTQEDFLAGGMLCGKSYADIEESLERFDYKKV